MKRKIITLLSVFTVFALALCAYGGFFMLKPLEKTDFETFSREVSRITAEYDGEITADDFENGRTYRVVVKSSLKVNKLNSVDSVTGFDGLQVFQFEDEESADYALEYYNGLKSVEYAVEDKLVCTELVCETVADLGSFYVFASADGIHPTEPQADACGITALRNYIEESGTEFTKDIVVAVVDSGVDSDHEFISHRLLSEGKSFLGNGNPEDEYGHGTHVTGIIVDNTPDNVKIASYRVLNSNGMGTELQTANGIYAAVEDGVDLINLSLTMASESSVIHGAVKKAYESNITVFCAAGNNATDISEQYFSPANFEETITVMNVSNDYSEKAYNSNYGKECDIAAPGMDVISSYTNGRYRSMSGTSMASPFVCAAATYILLTDTASTPDEIKSILKSYSIAAAKQGYVGGLWAEYITREPLAECELMFGKEEGKFQREFYLEISCNEEDADIYYKTEIEGLTTAFKPYTEPLYISETTKVEAVAYKKGCKRTDVIGKTYEEDFSETDLFWESDLNGVVTQYKHFSNEITVPEYIKGVKTTGITAGVFDWAEPVSIVFPDSVTSLPDNAFKNSELLESVTANGVKALGDSVFEGCVKLTEISLPSVKTVGNNAFKESGIEKALLPNAEYIGDGAFYGCSSLKNAELSSVKTMGENPFYNCASLEELSMNSLEVLKENDFVNTAVKKEMYFPSVTSVGEGAFNNTYSTAAVFESVTECLSLPHCTKLALPASLKSCTVFENAFGTTSTYNSYKEKGINILNENTAIYENLPSSYIWGTGEVSFGVIGFNRQYGWYGTNTRYYSGDLLEGENTCTLNPSDYDGYEYFYCEVAVTDSDATSFTVRSGLLKAHTVTQTEWSVYTEPTCTEEGLSVKYCDDCGEAVLTSPIEPKGHTWKHNSYCDEHPHYSNEKCTECGATHINTEKTKKVSKCIDCQYDYESDGNGGVRITKCKKTNSIFTVPDEINGLSVTEIGANAFSGLKATNIILSDGVKYIDENAFSNCTRLLSLQIPTTLEYISDNAVDGCSDSLSVICRESTVAYKFAKRVGVGITKIIDFILGENAHLSEEHQLVIVVDRGGSGTLDGILTFADGLTSRLVPSYDYNKTQIYATGSVIDVTSSTFGEAVYRIVVPGDLTGDGVVDALDVAFAERMLSGHEENVSECVKLAATYDRGGDITAEDYSRIVNDALAP